MHAALELRNRIALLLASSGLVALPACGSTVETSATTGGTGGSTSASSGTTGSTTSSTGTGTVPIGCDNPSEECQTPGPAGCPDKSEVENSCCNVAAAGPSIKNGECCYQFCEGPCCGRPFTVAGHARTAGVTARDDWHAPQQREASLGDEARAALVDAWLTDAQMEHASVASFARFTLELMALGAPADLVEASQRASLDEIEHARLCFGIAARLAGRTFGPAALDLGGALRTSSLAEGAAHAVREGCIGETIAALTARAQLARAEDEGIRRVLARIAEDEEAHAALAFRFVAWAIAEGGASVRRAVADAFADGARRARAAQAAAIDGIDVATWHRFGRIMPDEAVAVAASAIDDVILPCASMLSAGDAADTFALDA
ncbi:Hypothetical protein A7982_04632 [Minicystis rosea]|nr:Hypothetical protein A7982_04632 [Minicystis rosea]